MSMLLYKDEAFEDRWTTVPSLTLEDEIFVKVFMVNDRYRQGTLLCLFELHAYTDLIIVYAELELGDMALKLYCCILKLHRDTELNLDI